MDATAAVKLVNTFPVLATLPVSVQQQLLQEADHVTVGKDQVLFDQASPCLMYPLLLDGSIRVVSMSEQGRELLLYRVRPGELCIISSSCMLGKATYPATGISESELSLVVLPALLFNTLLTETAFREFVFETFSDRLSDLMQLVEAVTFLRLDQRLAALLLTKGQEIHTTHQKLADELGSVRELISRLLKRFEAQGMIALQREYIQILDLKALQAIAR